MIKGWELLASSPHQWVSCVEGGAGEWIIKFLNKEIWRTPKLVNSSRCCEDDKS